MGDVECHGEMIWSLNEKDGFSVNSMYGALCPHVRGPNPGIYVWNAKVPLKVSFFMWELWWNCVPTIDNLRARGMILFVRA